MKAARRDDSGRTSSAVGTVHSCRSAFQLEETAAPADYPRGKPLTRLSRGEPVSGYLKRREVLMLAAAGVAGAAA